MLKISNISKTFFKGTQNEKKALIDLSLTLNDGDFCTVIGGNGAGKSTLLNSISGAYIPESGKVEIDGKDVTHMPEYKRAKYIGRVFQDPMKGTASGMQLEENLILPTFRKLKFVDCNKPFWRKLMYKAFVRAKSGCDKWHDYEMTVAPYDKDKPIYYEFTSCPAAEFAIRHGLTDIMPALCNVDYASMELLRARLVRTTTCVDGCRCDYTIFGNKDPWLKEHPEYRDEAGFRKNK